MRRYFLKIVFFLLMVCNIKETKAQLPSGDAAFTQVIIDNFDSLKTSLWDTNYPWGPTNNGLEYNSPSNLLFNYTTGWLAIKCETVAPITYTLGSHSPYKYQSGAIWSKAKFKYGYYEMSAKLPVGYRGYWGGLWLYTAGSNSCTAPGYSGYWNEIDVIENNGAESLPNYQMGYHYIWRDTTNCFLGVDGGLLTGLPDLLQEHKYAVFWEPDRLTYYFDDMPFRTIIDPVYTPNHALTIFINFAIDFETNPPRLPDTNTVFPAYLQVNYLKGWQLIPDCATAASFCSTFNAGTYVSKVKQSISLSGTGCSDNINTSSNVSFWATDYILLGTGATITDDGSGTFTAEITKCPN